MRVRVAAALLAFSVPLHAGSNIVATSAALSTASPYATSIGLTVLKNGGNAMDAAVAVAFALAVVHPQAGNIGGGGFLVYYDAKSKGTWALDFRETAPGAATGDMFLLPDGKVSPEIRTGPKSAAVPGTVAGLATAHDRFGSRPWKELLAPAIALARDGFPVDRRLAADLAEEKNDRKIDEMATTKAIFFPDGKPPAAGTKLVQADLAATLERIAANGEAGFYSGETATRMVDSIKAAGGIISDRDLRDYKALWRAPLKIAFGDYSIYTVPPPSAGGIVLAEALNILSGYDLGSLGFQTARSIHLEAEAERRAAIDRNRYIGDPATSRIPYRDLLSPQRAALWRASIDLQRATPTVTLTEPTPNMAEGKHTTHFSIADKAGNIASLTTTLNENFGSGYVAGGCGFFLNNSMDDFSAGSGKVNRYGMAQSSANAIEPGKRMVSSMTPLIVFRKDRPFMALGTRGGPAIPTTVLQVLLNVIVFNKSLPDAVAAPRYHHQGMPEDIYYEQDVAPKALIDALGAMGHGVRGRDSIGDVHAVQFTGGRIVAVADPRSGGAAGGF
ncbi:MAG TPA: gamma-glutamyltransferase [Thermoanaerobaculia bacterium]|nr:gamma-glutamyltransferase [Thermoanaerobaculia bacterium]